MFRPAPAPPELPPHSFFDRSFDEWREACDDAWRRVLGFIATGEPRTGGPVHG